MIRSMRRSTINTGQWYKSMLVGNSSIVGAYELISTAFGTGSSGVIDFTSIPSDYRHLQIRFTAKNSSTATQINLTMNGITTASYARHTLQGSGGVESSTNAINQTSIPLTGSMASSAGVGVASGGVIDILDYTSSSKNTTIRALYGQIINSNLVYLASGALFNTAAINRITLTASANNFDAISRFSLYGIRG